MATLDPRLPVEVGRLQLSENFSLRFSAVPATAEFSPLWSLYARQLFGVIALAPAGTFPVAEKAFAAFGMTLVSLDPQERATLTTGGNKVWRELFERFLPRFQPTAPSNGGFMIDLHTHTLFSDGELIPAELTRRAACAGYRALAMTDHVDLSNLDFILPRLLKVAADLGQAWGLTVLAGVELTHIPPAQIAAAAAQARQLGAQIIVCHGETIVEPVAPGTNLAALAADIDILSHPGLLTAEEAALAAQRGIFLEITTRKGHSLTNGHVVRMAQAAGARLVVNNDAHAPGDLVSLEMARKIARGAGLDDAGFAACRRNSEELVEKALRLGRNEA